MKIIMWARTDVLDMWTVQKSKKEYYNNKLKVSDQIVTTTKIEGRKYKLTYLALITLSRIRLIIRSV